MLVSTHVPCTISYLLRLNGCIFRTNKRSSKVSHQEVLFESLKNVFIFSIYYDFH